MTWIVRAEGKWLPSWIFNDIGSIIKPQTDPKTKMFEAMCGLLLLDGGVEHFHTPKHEAQQFLKIILNSQSHTKLSCSFKLPLRVCSNLVPILQCQTINQRLKISSTPHPSPTPPCSYTSCLRKLKGKIGKDFFPPQDNIQSPTVHFNYKTIFKYY